MQHTLNTPIAGRGPTSNQHVPLTFRKNVCVYACVTDSNECKKSPVCLTVCFLLLFFLFFIFFLFYVGSSFKWFFLKDVTIWLRMQSNIAYFKLFFNASTINLYIMRIYQTFLTLFFLDCYFYVYL